MYVKTNLKGQSHWRGPLVIISMILEKLTIITVKPMLYFFRDHIYIINMESKLNQPIFLLFYTFN